LRRSSKGREVKSVKVVRWGVMVLLVEVGGGGGGNRWCCTSCDASTTRLSIICISVLCSRAMMLVS
jgi:hypothetical protein